MLQHGFLFKNSHLCIPKCSMRENLIQEKKMEDWQHTLGLTRHLDKSHFYFWPRMRPDVHKFLSKCKVRQQAKGRSQNIGL